MIRNIAVFITIHCWILVAAAQLGDLQFSDIYGTTFRSSDLFAGRAIVFLQGSDCPISKRQSKTIESLTRKFGKKYKVVVIETASDSKPEFKKQKLQIQVVDRERQLARLLGAKTTTESFLIAGNKILYRGAIENKITFSGTKPSSSVKFLENAISDFENSREIRVKETEAFGCYLEQSENLSAAYSAKRFDSEIRPIVASRCLNCHAEGKALPNFSSLKTLVEFKPTIRYVIDKNIMPPWSAVGGHWSNDLRLTDGEKASLLAWTASKSELPAKTEIIEAAATGGGTESGEWDMLEYELAPAKIDAYEFRGYKFFKLNLKNSEDMWIDLIRFKSSVKGSLHHALAIARPIDVGPEQGFGHQTAPLQHVGFYTSGLEFAMPEESRSAGILIPKNSTLYFQVHYEPTGKPETDRLKILIPKLRKKPELMLQIISAVAKNEEILILPFAKDTKVELKTAVPSAGTLRGVYAHMHFRGRGFLMNLMQPTGPIELLRIDNFNYKMQLIYEFKTPVPVKKGQSVVSIGWFDNSADNPDNPAPQQLVRGGKRAADEMLFGVFFLMSPAEEAEAAFRAVWKP